MPKPNIEQEKLKALQADLHQKLLGYAKAEGDKKENYNKVKHSFGDRTIDIKFSDFLDSPKFKETKLYQKLIKHVEASAEYQALMKHVEASENLRQELRQQVKASENLCQELMKHVEASSEYQELMQHVEASSEYQKLMQHVETSSEYQELMKQVEVSSNLHQELMEHTEASAQFRDKKKILDDWIKERKQEFIDADFESKYIPKGFGVSTNIQRYHYDKISRNLDLAGSIVFYRQEINDHLSDLIRAKFLSKNNRKEQEYLAEELYDEIEWRTLHHEIDLIRAWLKKEGKAELRSLNQKLNAICQDKANSLSNIKNIPAHEKLVELRKYLDSTYKKIDENNNSRKSKKWNKKKVNFLKTRNKIMKKSIVEDAKYFRQRLIQVFTKKGYLRDHRDFRGLITEWSSNLGKIKPTNKVDVLNLKGGRRESFLQTHKFGEKCGKWLNRKWFKMKWLNKILRVIRKKRTNEFNNLKEVFNNSLKEQGGPSHNAPKKNRKHHASQINSYRRAQQGMQANRKNKQKKSEKYGANDAKNNKQIAGTKPSISSHTALPTKPYAIVNDIMIKNDDKNKLAEHRQEIYDFLVSGEATTETAQKWKKDKKSFYKFLGEISDNYRKVLDQLPCWAASDESQNQINPAFQEEPEEPEKPEELVIISPH